MYCGFIKELELLDNVICQQCHKGYYGSIGKKLN